MTDDTSPLLKGTLSAGLVSGDSVEIYRDGALIGTATVSGTDWTFQDSGLVNGAHVYTAKVVDLAGNGGAISDPATLTHESLLSLQANDTVVHEAALEGGTGKDWLADDGSDTIDLSASGIFSLGSTVTSVTITLGGQPTGLSLADLASGKTIAVGGDTLTITNLGDGQYGYTYTLGAPKSHDTSSGKVGEIVNNDFKIIATSASGTAEATGEIKIVNDEVTASPGDFVVEMPAPAEGVVITLVLDSSPSMAEFDGGAISRWDLAKQAILNLLNKYAEAYPADTQFEINLVAFDGERSKWPNSFQSGTFTSIEDAKAAIGMREMGFSGTYYDNALNEAQKLIQASMKSHPDYDQKVYFVTDGEPMPATRGVPTSWTNFVTANQDALDVYGVGLGPLVNNETAVNEIKKALAAGDPNDQFIQVVNATDLSDALMNTLPSVDGNLFGANASGKLEGVALGADGGFRLSKVTYDGTDYVFGSEGTVTIKIAGGLTMMIDSKGNYELTSSLDSFSLKVPMTFELTDADGDKSVITEQLQFGDPSHPTLVTVQVTSNTVHESSLPGGTGKNWLTNDGSSINDLTASGTFTLDPSVTRITISLGGVATGLTLESLSSNPTVQVGDDMLKITSLGNGKYEYLYTLGGFKDDYAAGPGAGEILHNDFQISAYRADGYRNSAIGDIEVVNDSILVVYKPLQVDLQDAARSSGNNQPYMVSAGSAPEQTYRLYYNGKAEFDYEFLLGSGQEWRSPVLYNNPGSRVFKLVVVKDGVEAVVAEHTGSELLADDLPIFLLNELVQYREQDVSGTSGVTADLTLHEGMVDDRTQDASALQHVSEAYSETALATPSEGFLFDVERNENVVGTAGDDTFRITAADLGSLNGGVGIDTLVMDATDMLIDLSALGLQSLEKINLGTGGNTLMLGAKEVEANGQTDLALTDGKKQMVINGASGAVDLLGGDAGPDGWSTEGATEVDGVTYNVYANFASNSELLVEDRVLVTIL